MGRHKLPIIIIIIITGVRTEHTTIPPFTKPLILRPSSPLPTCYSVGEYMYVKLNWRLSLSGNHPRFYSALILFLLFTLLLIHFVSTCSVHVSPSAFVPCNYLFSSCYQRLKKNLQSLVFFWTVIIVKETLLYFILTGQLHGLWYSCYPVWFPN